MKLMLCEGTVQPDGSFRGTPGVTGSHGALPHTMELVVMVKASAPAGAYGLRVAAVDGIAAEFEAIELDLNIPRREELTRFLPITIVAREHGRCRIVVALGDLQAEVFLAVSPPRTRA
jgi:hypothetical protein